MEQQKIIIIGGFAGAGKTTISRILAKNLHYPLLSSDDITHVIKNELNLAFHQVSPAGFETVWELVKIQVSLGNSCIIDANMCHEKSWKNVEALKNEFPLVDVHIFILESPLEVHKKRFIERTKAQKDPKKQESDTFEDLLYKYHFIKKMQRNDVMRINSHREIYETVNEILNKIEAPAEQRSAGGEGPEEAREEEHLLITPLRVAGPGGLS